MSTKSARTTDLRLHVSHTAADAAEMDYAYTVVEANVLGKPPRKAPGLALRHLATLMPSRTAPPLGSQQGCPTVLALPARRHLPHGFEARCLPASGALDSSERLVSANLPWKETAALTE